MSMQDPSQSKEDESMIPLRQLSLSNRDDVNCLPYQIIDMQECRRDSEVSPPTPPPRRAARLGCIGSITRDSPTSFPRIAGGLKLAQTQAMAVAVGFTPEPQLDRLGKRSPLLHRASFHGRGSRAGESNGSLTNDRLSHSLPGSPADRRPNFPEVVGSAESLVGRVLVEQGLGKFCDPEFVRYTSREMQEALDMTQEEMDRAAHRLLLQERQGRPLSFQGDPADPHL